VTLAHIIFLWHFRSILIVTLPLPISILISFLLMKEFGITSNIMSLTGIAIAIGVLVDAAIVVTENVIRHCEEAEGRKVRRRLTPAAETWHVTLAACQQVGRPIFFAMAIIILAFVPVFALTGTGGQTVPSARVDEDLRDGWLDAARGDACARVVQPAGARAVSRRGPQHRDAFLLKIYDPTLNWALNHRKTVMSAAALLLATALLIAFGLPRVGGKEFAMGLDAHGDLVQGFGKEFMPPLNEGSLLYMPVLMPRPASRKSSASCRGRIR
jgi:Cu(I)/Ag(I) efflux system membrane protein CusA/SilA